MQLIRCCKVRIGLLATLLIAGAAGLPVSSSAQTATSPAAAPLHRQRQKQVQVDLLRGLADIFSRGMDTLTDKLNRQGYSGSRIGSPTSTLAGTKISSSSSATRSARMPPSTSPTSWDRQNIPIELIVTFDATRPQPVAKNVLHLVNLYQENGFGEKVSAGPDFKGELTNIDLTADRSLSHTTIEKSPRLHALVMQKIVEIVNKDLPNRIRPKKSPARPRQNRRKRFNQVHFGSIEQA